VDLSTNLAGQLPRWLGDFRDNYNGVPVSFYFPSLTVSDVSFIISVVWGSLAAQFLVQTISFFTSACVYLYGLLFSRVKKRLNAPFFGTALTQAALFAVLFVGGFWLIGLFVEHPVPVANWITGFVAFIVTFTYYAVQVPDKIRVARMCAMKPLFAEFAKAQGMKAALKTRH
jgi:uncharacterized protein with PQ loop repeat